MGLEEVLLQVEKDAKERKEGHPPKNNAGKLITVDEEKAEGPSNFFAPVFSGKFSSHTSQMDGQQNGTGEQSASHYK